MLIVPLALGCAVDDLRGDDALADDDVRALWTRFYRDLLGR